MKTKTQAGVPRRDGEEGHLRRLPREGWRRQKAPLKCNECHKKENV